MICSSTDFCLAFQDKEVMLLLMAYSHYLYHLEKWSFSSFPSFPPPSLFAAKQCELVNSKNHSETISTRGI